MGSNLADVIFTQVPEVIHFSPIMVETHRRGLQDTEAEEEGLSFSRELLIKQPILELEVTGT